MPHGPAASRGGAVKREGDSMKRGIPAWFARPSLLGACVGIIGAILLWVTSDAGPLARASFAIGGFAVAYLAGLVLALRHRERDSQRRLLDQAEELRLSQDHIMANETFRSLGAYLEILAHQMKEPLEETIDGINRLASDGALPEGARQVVAHLKDRGEALHANLKHLTGYGMAKPGRAPFGVNTLLREAILLCRHRAAEKKIRFEERYATVPPVFGSAVRVHQAVFNVIINAVEAMPYSGGTIVVETSLENDRVVARVSDTGIGVRPDHLPRIFEPFFSTKPEKKGVGLGLWTARQMLDIIGADISVASAPFKGTTVTMSFPQAAPLRPGREGVAHPPEFEINTADPSDRQIA
jgi:signal transduction histidine kinase